MRHAVILVTCPDLEYLHPHKDYTTIKLRHVNAVVRQIVRHISNPKGPPSPHAVDHEDMLFAIMSLAKQGTSTSMKPTPGTFGLFDPAPQAQNLQFLNIWGQQNSNQVHCMGMQHLVRWSRRFLPRATDADIITPGFTMIFYQFDIMESAKTLNRPWCDIPASAVEFLQQRIAPLRLAAGQIYGPDLFLQRGILLAESPLMDIILDIHIELAFIQAKKITGVIPPWMPSLNDLALLRDLIVHRLLAFTPTTDSIEEQLCHTATLIFTNCVLYPLPNRAPFDILLERLRASLRMIERQRVDVDDAFLVWAAMVGAMACQATDESRRQFFLARLRLRMTRLGLSSWMQLKGVLDGFLWLEQACDAGGLAIWGMLSRTQERPIYAVQ